MSDRRGWAFAALLAATAGCSDNEHPGQLDAAVEVDAASVVDAGQGDAEIAPDEVCVGAAPLGHHPPRPPTAILPDVQSLDVAPPPVSGGTLAVSADGLLAVAADPDRDQVYVVDLAAQQLLHTVGLDAGDEPGRVALDDGGRAHVALRGGGSVASIDLATGEVVDRRAVCDLPRGIAYDAVEDTLYVGCYEGRVVRLGASGGEPEPPYELGVGVRDVLVQGDTLRVSRFREAELLIVDKDTGALVGGPSKPPSLTLERLDADSCEVSEKHFEPAVSWRIVEMPDGSTLILHQRQQTTEVPTGSGGYGGGFCESGVVQTVVAREAGDGVYVSAAVPDMALAVDMAVSPDGSRLAVGGPGNASLGSRVAVLEMGAYMAAAQGEQQSAQDEFSVQGCALELTLPPVEGEVISVAFDAEGNLLVQSREPSTLQFLGRGVLTGEELWTPAAVALGTDSRRDAGHELFHHTTDNHIACASCHPEAGDDGNVWTFEGVGPRRTQNVSGGVLATEPLHWQGDMKDFSMLFEEVFVGRMTGFPLEKPYVDALAAWVDKQPSLKRTPSDEGAAERGRALFESTEVGCAECHSGPLLTNNATVDVGTGGALQVPSLTGLSFRAPYIHNGCADTLRARFSECGGGDRHGKTSQLGESELDDLIAYLESL